MVAVGVEGEATPLLGCAAASPAGWEAAMTRCCTGVAAVGKTAGGEGSCGMCASADALPGAASGVEAGWGGGASAVLATTRLAGAAALPGLPGCATPGCSPAAFAFDNAAVGVVSEALLVGCVALLVGCEALLVGCRAWLVGSDEPFSVAAGTTAGPVCGSRAGEVFATAAPGDAAAATGLSC